MASTAGRNPLGFTIGGVAVPALAPAPIVRRRSSTKPCSGAQTRTLTAA